MYKRLILLTLAMGVFSSASVQASSVLVSNLAEPTRATSALDVGLWAAQSFSTDANSYNLVDIMALLGGATGGPLVVAELRQDTPTGALLTTFAVPDLTGAVAVKTLTPLLGVSLSPSTTYWLILGVSNSGGFGWSYAEGNNWVGPGALSFFGYSTDQGASWGAFDIFNPYQIAVDVSSSTVPEPSTLVAGLSALLVASGFRFRRR